MASPFKEMAPLNRKVILGIPEETSPEDSHVRKGNSYQRSISRVVILMTVAFSHVSIDETVTPDLTDIPQCASERQVLS